MIGTRLKAPALLILALLTILPLGAVAQAEQPPAVVALSPSEMLAQLESSVVRIQGISPRGVFSGSGAFVPSREGTAVITAKHVASAGAIGVQFRGKIYFPDRIVNLPEADAAILFFLEKIPGAVPLELDLDPSGGVVNVIAAGYWGRSTRIGDKARSSLTLTAGRISRTVIPIMNVGGDRDRAVLLADTLLYPGYSGGVVLNEKTMKIVGINIALNIKHTLYTDIRYVYNQVPELRSDPKHQVAIPYDDNYDIHRVAGIDRMPVDEQGTIQNKAGESLTLKQFYDILDSNLKRFFEMSPLTRPSTPFGAQIESYFSPKTVITIGGKKYQLTAIEIHGSVRGSQAFSPLGNRYLYYVGEKYALFLFLKEVVEPVDSGDGRKAPQESGTAGKR